MTKRLPRRDARRQLSMDEMFALMGEDRDEIVKTFGSEALARVLYETHRDEINRSGHPGRRSGAWWLWDSGASKEALKELLPPRAAYEVSRGSIEEHLSAEDVDDARRILWLHENGHLEEWERKAILEEVRSGHFWFAPADEMLREGLG